MKERTKNRHRNLFFDASHMRNFLILHTLSPCIKETFITEGGIGWLKLGCGTKKENPFAGKAGKQGHDRVGQGMINVAGRISNLFSRFLFYFLYYPACIVSVIGRGGHRKGLEGKASDDDIYYT